MGRFEDMVNTWIDAVEKDKQMEEIKRISEAVSDTRPPECSRCWYYWTSSCPCGYSCCNAACLIIFKPLEIQLEETKIEDDKDEET